MGNVAPDPTGYYLRPIEPGTIAVYMFFVASGFIITEAVHRFYSQRPAAFLLNRWIRILPLVLLALTLNAMLWALLIASGDHLFLRVMKIVCIGALRLLPFTKSIPLEFEPLPISWTLRVELVFYIFCFAVLLISPVINLGRYRHAVITAVMTTLFALFFFDQARASPSLLRFIPYFTTGAASYFVASKTYSRIALPCLMISLVGLGVEQFNTPVNHPALGHARNRDLQIFIFLVLLSAFFWLSVLRVSQRLAAVDRLIGELSYPLYIGHYTAFVICAGVGRVSWPWSAGFLLIAAGMTFSLWFIAERPLALLRERVRGISLLARREGH
jgi:peptidoglycan/LPS O-acetylase OafA/YrhL